jgi:hypothetical protein
MMTIESAETSGRQKGYISNLRDIFDDLQKSRVTERQNGSKVTYNNSESKIPDISTTQKDTDGYDDDRKCRNIRSHSGRQGSSSG